MPGFQRDDNNNLIVTPRAFDFSLGGDAGVTLAVTASAQALTPSQTVPAMGCQALLTNVGTQTVFVRKDGTVPTTANGWPILPNSQIVISIGNADTIQCIAAATGSSVTIVLGYGE